MAESTEIKQDSISNIFDEGFELYNGLNTCSDPTNSDAVQVMVKKAISVLENTSRMVSVLSMFSENENIEEVSTADLKYLSLPYLLGMLKLKVCGGDRKQIIEDAEIYFKDYLKRLYNYGLTENNFSENKSNNEAHASSREKSETEILRSMINTRQSKIQRYQEQKELESKLKELKKCFDEDIKREYYLTLLKSFVYQAVDELKSIEMEKPMIEMLKARQIEQGGEIKKKYHPGPSNPPLRPIIITKDQVQKAVFGAGYPSLPVMTVDEFYDKRVQDGVFPDPTKPVKKDVDHMSLQEMALAGIKPDEDKEDAEMDEKEDTDDPELLERLRNKDEMKDQFRRGYGNRMNRS